MENVKLGFGQMGFALANGILQNNIIKKENIYYHDPKKNNNTFNYLNSNEEVIRTCDIIICAVKPDIVSHILKDVGKYLMSKLLISICAGVKIEKLEQLVGKNNKVVRVMPNTPCLVGESASTFCVNKNVNDVDKKYVIDIFSSCGIIHEIEEKYMDITTALVGSGPAYVYLFIESLIDAGVKNGLSRELSKKLVLQTIYGSVKMTNTSNLPVQQLKDNVCSPGGTTAVGLFTLEKNHFKYSIIEAIDAACEKSKLMSK
ncbi:pyrroline-5-carboxylate reductase, putative [Plasmodium gallinaceum]|uniref:Pyrroline-5-carboxylate reductase n=1 Tax=Plasmodium gallinaceum TaxID=5849 RepID=A0A1J1GN88_PLAGA|nr:pyrroline-5-carboxylate reductase, putative [Plasmodium gallinaceum]CRG93935.1 pyrroline-5-carboxylate reductase, putative [Plasmodium gallinaceum]